MDVQEPVSHRERRQRLELALFEASSPAMPYWQPAGMVVMRELREMWLREHLARGYVEMFGPQLADESIFAVSGHSSHYREGMFWAERFGLKPMNCPGAMLLFARRRHSYRELPLRLYCEDLLHRNELSGVLNSILRVQELRQDDAHIFLPIEEVQSEMAAIFDLAEDLYGPFDLSFRLRLGTAPVDRLGDDAVWDRALLILREALDRFAGVDGYEVAEGEGSFYAPKIDFLMTDSFGREWQTGAVQLDLQLPERFGCLYVDQSAEERVPALIHRAIAGSFERFLGVLLEHVDGRLPSPMCPTQVLAAPVGPRHVEGAQALALKLRAGRARVEVGDGRRTVSALVREASERRIPFLAVVGDKELQEGLLSVRRSEGRSELVPPDVLAAEAGRW